MNFQQAAISWFGLPSTTTLSHDPRAPGALTFVVTLAAEDLVGIAQRMQVQEEPLPGFVDWERLDRGQMSLEQLREDYAALTPAQRGKYGSFGRYRAARQEQFEADGLTGVWVEGAGYPGDAEKARGMGGGAAPANSEGVGGRKVVHVDVPEEESAQRELPAAVWVDQKDLRVDQLPLASDSRDGKWLIQVDMLTSEQKAKYGVALQENNNPGT